MIGSSYDPISSGASLQIERKLIFQIENTRVKNLWAQFQTQAIHNMWTDLSGFSVIVQRQVE